MSWKPGIDSRDDEMSVRKHFLLLFIHRSRQIVKQIRRQKQELSMRGMAGELGRI